MINRNLESDLSESNLNFNRIYMYLWRILKIITINYLVNYYYLWERKNYQ